MGKIFEIFFNIAVIVAIIAFCAVMLVPVLGFALACVVALPLIIFVMLVLGLFFGEVELKINKKYVIGKKKK